MNFTQWVYATCGLYQTSGNCFPKILTGRRRTRPQNPYKTKKALPVSKISSDWQSAPHIFRCWRIRTQNLTKLKRPLLREGQIWNSLILPDSPNVLQEIPVKNRKFLISNLFWTSSIQWISISLFLNPCQLNQFNLICYLSRCIIYCWEDGM